MITNISQKEKVDLIFKYIFESDAHIQEEDFWNKLTKQDLKELEKIKGEKNISFQDLKASL